MSRLHRDDIGVIAHLAKVCVVFYDLRECFTRKKVIARIVSWITHAPPPPVTISSPGGGLPSYPSLEASNPNGGQN